MAQWNPTEFEFKDSQFAGEARLLPLPDMVLFPHVMQPIHIFEPRYRALTASALKDDGLIALASLEPGWEADYEGRPAVATIACLGTIVAHTRLPDGRFNLLLLGVRRVRIASELPPEQAYRRARVDVVPDIEDGDPARQRDVRQALITALESRLPQGMVAPENLSQLTADDVSLGRLTDVVSYLMPLEATTKAELLAEPRVLRRAEVLLSNLEQVESFAKSNRPAAFKIYPPPFSVN